MSDTVTIDPMTDTIVWFRGSESVVWPAGNYIVAYVTGAMKYTAGGWTVNYNSSRGCFITDGASNLIEGPGVFDGTTGPDTEAGCWAANAGLTVLYHHLGGPIGMYCSDFDGSIGQYDDNTSGTPPPIFSLTSPVIAVPDLVATPILTGTPANIPAIQLTGS